MRSLLTAAFVTVAALTAVPCAAHAQFAGVINLPPRRRGPVELTAEARAARQDSVRREAMFNMRAWVDSAAGIVVVTPAAPTPPGTVPAPRRDSTSTASPAAPARPPRR